MARPLLLDVDTGVDDAIAIALASRLSRHQLVALTTVAGNVPIEFSTTNTQRVAGWLDLDVPIYRGMSEPLARPLLTAREHHGHDGLGGWAPDAQPVPLQPESAPEAIVRHARQHRGEITFVFVGPLTNLAVALALEPRVADWVHRLIIMGGAFGVPGNTTETAEFNVLVDPEAAAKVARSGFRATWVPLDATHQAGFSRSQWELLSGAREPAAALVREVTRRSLVELGRSRFHLHDPLAVAVAEAHDVVETDAGSVVVDVSQFAPGRTRLSAPVGAEVACEVARRPRPGQFADIFGLVVGSEVASLAPS